MSHVLRLQSVLAAALLLTVPVMTPAQTADEPAQQTAAEIATVQRVGTTLSVSVSPPIAYQSAILRVSGPDDYALSKRFEGHGAISADLLAEAEPREVDDDGHAEPVRFTSLPAGRYRYEVDFNTSGGRQRHSGSFQVR